MVITLSSVIKKVKTGIPGFDELLYGGIPEKK
jgi:KaiC/GvpD/RAD55 family RecA-like ATPase